MEKRGQITIFIIIAIVLVAGVALFFVFKDRLDIFTPKSDPVYVFVEECIKDTGEDAIYYIVENGGYLFPVEFSTSDGVPYYYYNGKNYMLPKDRIGEEISRYIEETLSYCTEDFVDFTNFNITEGEIEARTTIKDEEIVINVEYPITIRKGKSVTRLEKFKNIKILIELGLFYNSIEEIVQTQLSQEEICLSCISDIALKNYLTIDMTNTEEAVIFNVKSKYLKIKDVPLEWKFAMKY